MEFDSIGLRLKAGSPDAERLEGYLTSPGMEGKVSASYVGGETRYYNIKILQEDEREMFLADIRRLLPGQEVTPFITKFRAQSPKGPREARAIAQLFIEMEDEARKN